MSFLQQMQKRFSIVSTPGREQIQERFTAVSARGREQINEHHKWEHSHHFILMLCVSSTTLEEISNFPVRCYKYGKLIFFIIYAIIYFTFGIPMVILECQLSQYFGQSGLNVLRHICPLAGGLGIVQFLILCTYLLRSHLKSTLFINYVFSAMVFTAPWQTCGHIWSTTSCYTKHQYDKCYAIDKYFWNNTCMEPERFCEARNMTYENISYCIFKGEHEFIPHLITSNFSTPGWDYFVYKVSPIYHGGSFDVYFVCNISLIWTISVICLCKGINKTGVQVSFLLFITSNSILLLFLISILMHFGGFSGIAYGFKFDFGEFGKSQTWLMAMGEVIKTLSIGFGTNAVLASYNHFNTQLIPLIFSGGCLIIIINQLVYSLLVYALWGVSSILSKRNLPDIANRYTDLLAVFSMIPDLVQVLPAPHFWATLYYVAILCKIIGNNLITMEAIVISLGDISNFCNDHPTTTRYIVAVTGWFISLFGPFINPKVFVSEFFPVAGFELELLSMVEMLIFGLGYGFVSDLKFRQFFDLRDMLGYRTKFYSYLQIVYYLFVPFFIMFYLTLKIWNLKLIKVSVTAILIIVIIYLAKTPIIIISYSIYILMKAKTKRHMFMSIISPSAYWSQQPITIQPEYKPKHKPGSWKYKFAIVANHFGFHL